MVDWRQLPQVGQRSDVLRWLEFQANLGRAENTVLAYARALEDYLTVCQRLGVEPHQATQEHIAQFVQDMRTRDRGNGEQGLAGIAVDGLLQTDIQRLVSADHQAVDVRLETLLKIIKIQPGDFRVGNQAEVQFMKK